MGSRLAVALASLASLGAASILGQQGAIRQGHAAPTTPKKAAAALAQCSLRGTPVMGADVNLYASGRGTAAIARFTGLKSPLQVLEVSREEKSRIRIDTGFGSGGFRLRGFVDGEVLPVVTTQRVSIVEGHLWLDRGQPVRVLRHDAARFRVSLSVQGELEQTFEAWADCGALALGEPGYHVAHAPPAGSKSYVMNHASLEVYTSWKEERSPITVLRRSGRGGGVLLSGNERQGGFVHIHYSGGIVLDGWAKENELQSLPAGETLDQLPWMAPRSSPRLALAESPKTMRLSQEVPVRLEASARGKVIGYAEASAELFVVQTIAGWTSVLPKPLTVAPIGDNQFWLRTSAPSTKKGRQASP